MDTRPWIGIDENRPCKSKVEDFTCKGYTFKGTSTTMTDKTGESQMTIDGTFSWASVEGEVTRDTAKSMELGWMIETNDVEY